MRARAHVDVLDVGRSLSANCSLTAVCTLYNDDGQVRRRWPKPDYLRRSFYGVSRSDIARTLYAPACAAHMSLYFTQTVSRGHGGTLQVGLFFKTVKMAS